MTWVILRRATETDPWQLFSLSDEEPQDLSEPGEYRLIDVDAENTPPVQVVVPAADAGVNQLRAVAQAIRVQNGLPPLTRAEGRKLAPVAIALIKNPSLVDQIDLSALTGGTQ